MQDGKQKKVRTYLRKDLEKNPYANAREWYENSQKETVKTLVSRAILSQEDTLKVGKGDIVGKEKIKLTAEFLNVAANNKIKGTKDKIDKHNTLFTNDENALSDPESNRRYALIDQLVLESFMSRREYTVKIESERENSLGPINRLAAYFSPAGIEALKVLENRTLTDEKTNKIGKNVKKFNELELVVDHLCKMVNEAYKNNDKESVKSFFRVTASSVGQIYEESQVQLGNKSREKGKTKIDNEDSSLSNPNKDKTDQHIFETLLSLAERTPIQQKTQKKRKVFLDDSEKQEAVAPQASQKNYNPRILGKMIAQLDPSIIEANKDAMAQAVKGIELKVSYAVLSEHKKAFKHDRSKAKSIAANYDKYVTNVLNNGKEPQVQYRNEMKNAIDKFEKADAKLVAEEMKKSGKNIDDKAIATALLPYCSLEGVSKISKAQNVEESRKGFIGAFRRFARYMYVKVTENKHVDRNQNIRLNRQTVNISISDIIENVPKLQPNQREDFSMGSSINSEDNIAQDINRGQSSSSAHQGSSSSSQSPQSIGDGGPNYGNTGVPRESFRERVSGTASNVGNSIKSAATIAGEYALNTRVGSAILNRVSRTAGDVASVANTVAERTSRSGSRTPTPINSRSNSTNVSPIGSRRGSLTGEVGSSSGTNNLNNSQASSIDDDDKFTNDDQFRKSLITAIKSYGGVRSTNEKKDDYKRLTYLYEQCMKPKNDNKEMSKRDIEQQRLSLQLSQER